MLMCTCAQCPQEIGLLPSSEFTILLYVENLMSSTLKGMLVKDPVA